MTAEKTLVDYLTGRTIPDVGAEANRQAVMRFLVETKGFSKSEIAVDVPLAVEIDGEMYRSAVDIVVSVKSAPFSALRCTAGSVRSFEREIIAAARLLRNPPLPYAAVSDGKTAVMLETTSGRLLGEGMDSLLSRESAAAQLAKAQPAPLSPERLRQAARVFFSYDTMRVNRPETDSP